MSKKRHKRIHEDPDRDVLVRSYAVTHPPNLHLPERSFPRWSQLAYAAHGVMEVVTDEGTWVVPPHRAVWIPAGTRHGVRISGVVAVRTLYFKRRLGRGRTPRRCEAINVSALLRELVLHVTQVGRLERGNADHQALVRVVMSQLETLASVPLQLPAPSDPRADAAATYILEDLTREVDAAAKHSGASRRTLERLFVEETAMTLGRWRQRARLIEALRLLARGHDVTRVALEIGYNGASAFIAAFRAQLGATPARYFAAPPSS